MMSLILGYHSLLIISVRGHADTSSSLRGVRVSTHRTPVGSKRRRTMTVRERGAGSTGTGHGEAAMKEAIALVQADATLPLHHLSRIQVTIIGLPRQAGQEPCCSFPNSMKLAAFPLPDSYRYRTPCPIRSHVNSSAPDGHLPSARACAINRSDHKTRFPERVWESGHALSLPQLKNCLNAGSYALHIAKRRALTSTLIVAFEDTCLTFCHLSREAV